MNWLRKNIDWAEVIRVIITLLIISSTIGLVQLIGVGIDLLRKNLGL